ncbi:MAG TPA: hypothetical protein VMW60_01360 [Dehalococcoidales bacterium]|nr:hypothetical protein [Dehalococcoidales bacterium]
MKKVFVSAFIASLLLISLAVSGCTSPKGFSIYLTRENTPVSEMPALSHVELADSPVISIDDIISYNRETHEIELTADAYERVMELSIRTPMKTFVVCVDSQPIYWGAFWLLWSSQFFEGVKTMLPLLPSEEHLIQITLGYPATDLYNGEDPRSDPVILQSLEQAGKLK